MPNEIIYSKGHGGSGGVGAVVLDGGADFYAGLNQQLGARIDANVARAQQMEAQKDAQKAARANSLIANLKYNPKGARPQDLKYLTDNFNKIQDNAINILQKYNGDLSNPQAAGEWEKDVAQQQAKLLEENERSVAYNKITQDEVGQFTKKPDDYDDEHFTVRTAQRQATPLNGDGSVFQSTALAPSKPKLSGFISERFKTTKPTEEIKYENGKPVNVDLGSGNKGYVVSITRTPKQLDEDAEAIIAAPEAMLGAKSDFNREGDDIKNAYIALAGNTGVDPIKLYVRDRVGEANSEREITKPLRESTAEKEAIKSAQKGKDEAKTAMLFVEQFGNVLTGKAPVYPEKKTMGGDVVAFGQNFGKITADTYYTTALNNFQDESYTEAKIVENPDGTKVTTYDLKPSKITGIKFQNGKAYYTSPSAQSKLQGKNDGYEELKEEDLYRIGKFNGVSESAMRAALEKAGGYNNWIMQASKAASGEVPQVKSNVKVELPNTGEVKTKAKKKLSW